MDHSAHPTARITAVLPAGCLDHAEVLVEVERGAEPFRLRVDAGSARAILAEINGVPSDAAPVVDLLKVCLKAYSARPHHVELAPDGVQGVLYLGEESRVRGIRGLPAATCLLLAARLDLPVRVRGAVAAAIEPPAFDGPLWEFVETLDLDLGHQRT